MDPLSITASAAQLLALGGTIISKGYSYVAKVRAFPKDLERLLFETAALNQTLSQLVVISDTQPERRTKKAALQALEEFGCLDQCKKSLEALEALIAACQRRPGENLKNTRKAALWPLKNKEANKILLSIQRLQQVFQSALAVDNASSLIDLEEQLKALSINFTEDFSQLTILARNILAMKESNQESISSLSSDNRDSKRWKILSWLSSTDPWPKHQAVTALHEPQTGMWLFSEPIFKEWKENGPLLWIQGSSGVGKTVLTSSIINELSEDNRRHNECANAVAFHYCDFGAEDTLRVISVLRSILRQVVAQQCQIPDCVLNAYESCSGRERFSVSDVIGHLINIADADAGKIHIIIDGIDETRERMDLFKAFLQLSKSPAARAFRILIVSRPLYDVQQIFSGPHLSLGAHKLAADIECYVKSEIRKHEKFSRISDDLRVSIEFNLCSRACGMFRWVKCQFDVLKKARTSADISRSLREIPPGLDETYDKILSSIPEDDRERVRRALYWTINTDRPLSLDELAEAVAIDPSRVKFDTSMRLLVAEDLLEICGSLVQLNSTGKGIELAHYSVQEYLLSPRLASKDMPICCFAVDGSTHLITSSLLTYNLFIALDIVSTSMPDSLSSLACRFPLVEYVHRYCSDLGRGDYAALHDWFERSFSTRDAGQTLSRLEDVLFNDNPRLRSQDEEYSDIIDGIAEILRKNLMGFLDRELGSTIPEMEDHIHETLQLICKSQRRWEKVEENASNQRGRDWNWEYSPLQAAATFGFDRIVRFLLLNGACVNGVHRPDTDHTVAPIHCAVWGNHEAVVRTLIGHGANPNYTANSTRYHTGPVNSLSIALDRSPGLIKVLLELGADPNHYDYDSLGYNFHHWRLHDSRTILQLRGNFGIDVQLGGVGCALPNLNLRRQRILGALQLYKSHLETSPDPKDAMKSLFGRSMGPKWLSEALVHEGLNEYGIIFMELVISKRGDGTLEHFVVCDECDGPSFPGSINPRLSITGPRYKCLDCIDVDLCAPCYDRVISGEVTLRTDFLQICSGHKWVKVPRDCWYELPKGVATESGQSLMEVVDELLLRYTHAVGDVDEGKHGTSFADSSPDHSRQSASYQSLPFRCFSGPANIQTAKFYNRH